jgi:hypothetical protein
MIAAGEPDMAGFNDRLFAILRVTFPDADDDRLSRAVAMILLAVADWLDPTFH